MRDFHFYRVFTVGDVWAMCGRCVGDEWAMCGRCTGCGRVPGKCSHYRSFVFAGPNTLQMGRANASQNATRVEDWCFPPLMHFNWAAKAIQIIQLLVDRE